MKHFYTVLAAALMASAVATAQPMPSKGMRFNYDKKQVAAKKSGYLPMLQFAKSRPHKGTKHFNGATT